MARWDAYVDESLAYLKSDFDIKFFSERTQKYAIMIQFVDALALKEGIYKYETIREPLAALFYLIIGGKDLMCALPVDYPKMSDYF